VAVALFGVASLAFAALRVRGLFETDPLPEISPAQSSGPGGAGADVPSLSPSPPREFRTAALLAAATRGSPFAASDPFRSAPAPLPRAGLRLRAILRDGDRSLALIGDRIYRVGERVPFGTAGEAAELTSIHPGRIVLRLGTEVLELPLRREPSDPDEKARDDR
jgi:hypothetical protein